MHYSFLLLFYSFFFALLLFLRALVSIYFYLSWKEFFFHLVHFCFWNRSLCRKDGPQLCFFFLGGWLDFPICDDHLKNAFVLQWFFAISLSLSLFAFTKSMWYCHQTVHLVVMWVVCSYNFDLFPNLPTFCWHFCAIKNLPTFVFPSHWNAKNRWGLHRLFHALTERHFFIE